MQKLAIGIDIGGTNTVFGLIDREGNSLAEGAILTQTHKEFEFFLRDLIAGLKSMIAQVPQHEIIGIGIGAPNANYATGNIEEAANLPWVWPVPLRQAVSDAFSGMLTVVTNDANAAAVGEMIYGGAKGMKDFIVVTLGTGLGSGIVANGELVYGSTGLAGELGHVIVNNGGRECGCGRKGCLETYASATGIKRTAFKLLADSNHDSQFRKYSFDELTAKMITDAAIAGDPLAIEAYRHTGEVLGRALANAVSITSPEAIFLFGGLARAGKYIFEPTEQAMNENMLFSFRNTVKLLPSQIDNKNAAVLLGASALVWQEYEK